MSDNVPKGPKTQPETATNCEIIKNDRDQLMHAQYVA